jgi:hypothetical protein
MSETQDTPKFTVINRRKLMDEETEAPGATGEDAGEHSSEKTDGKMQRPVAEEHLPQTTESPRLRLVEMPEPKTNSEAVPEMADEDAPGAMPTGPTSEESRFQKLQYDQSSERLETLVRAQNPGAPAMEKIGFEHLVQQLYLSALMQMGAGTPEGQRPRVDILGARQTIDLMGVLQEKTAGNLTQTEKQTLETVLYELRMTFLELTRMISMQPPPPPGGAKH